MSSEENGIWQWVSGAVLSAAGAVAGAWKYIDSRLEKKADKHAVNNQFQRVENEMTMQRGHIAKVFDQMRENEQRAQDRHERIMERLTDRR